MHHAQVLYFSMRETKEELCWEQAESWVRSSLDSGAPIKIYFVLYAYYDSAFLGPSNFQQYWHSITPASVVGKQSP